MKKLPCRFLRMFFGLSTTKLTKFYVWSYRSVSRITHFSSSFPGSLIVHGLPVSCPFNFPNCNLKQQCSHIGVFICYQNINAKTINLHIYCVHLLNPYKTVVNHLKTLITSSYIGEYHPTLYALLATLSNRKNTDCLVSDTAFGTAVSILWKYYSPTPQTIE